MLAALTGAGLSAAAGLNAYIPFILVALIARFTDVINLPHQYAWIESNWAIGIAAVLLLSEVVLDKVALVDHLNDAVGTFVRPATGGLIFAATTAAADEPSPRECGMTLWASRARPGAVAPRRARPRATSRPVPAAAPVTRARRPVRSGTSSGVQPSRLTG